MPLRNLPTDSAQQLASLVEARPGQVVSRSLTTADTSAAATLLAFAPGESVSEERYPQDTLYLCVEGACAVTTPEGGRIELVEGDVLRVPAQVEHAVEGAGNAFKILQLSC